VPAGGVRNPLPGGSGNRPAGMTTGLRAARWTGTGGGGGSPPTTTSQEARLEPSGGVRSPKREPRRSVGRRARPESARPRPESARADGNIRLGAVRNANCVDQRSASLLSFFPFLAFFRFCFLGFGRRRRRCATWWTATVMRHPFATHRSRFAADENSQRPGAARTRALACYPSS